MYSEELVKYYAEEVLRKSFIVGESGIDIAIEEADRNSDLALSVKGYLEQRMRTGEISIEEPNFEQFLNFVETVYRRCVHEGLAPSYRRNLEVLVYEMAADKEAKAS